MRSHNIRTACATQVREDMKGALHVSGHVDFRHDIDVTLSSVPDHIATLFLRVVAAIRNVVVEAHFCWGDDALLAHTAFLCKVGQSLHLEAPALVLRQMPMELVAAVQGHHIEELLDELDREEMATAVEQDAAIGEARLVGNLHKRKLNLLGVLRDGQAFAKCLSRTEQANGLVGSNENAVLVHLQGVALFLLLRKCDGLLVPFALLRRSDKREADGRFGICRRLLQLDSSSFLRPFLQELRNAYALGIVLVESNTHAACQGKQLRCVHLHLFGHRDDVVAGTLSRSKNRE